MTELEPRLADALTQIADVWSAERSERTLSGTRTRHRRSRRQRGVLAGGLGVSAVLCAVWLVWPRADALPSLAAELSGASQGSPAGGPVQFEDGSRIELLDPASRVVVDEVRPERISVRLLSGQVRVNVARRPERAFRVACGAVSVAVLGTAFELTRDGEQTHVNVLHGRVAVQAPDGSSELGAGEAAWFPSAKATADLHPSGGPATDISATDEERSLRGAATEASAGNVRRQRGAAANGSVGARGGVAVARALPPRAARDSLAHGEASWQAQARRGDYERAYALLPAAPEALANDVEALLLAADAARLSGHPGQALPYLRQVIERHPRDSRASLAAFTLAGVLLHELDRPREADAAYERARGLGLSSALAQDALARQVEAAERAGDRERMRELAREYLRRYPDGRRVHWVRETSGL